MVVTDYSEISSFPLLFIYRLGGGRNRRGCNRIVIEEDEIEQDVTECELHFLSFFFVNFIFIMETG